MKRRPDPALDLAHRIAAGEWIDPVQLSATDPTLARGLERISAIGRALAPDGPIGASWGHLQRLEFAGSGSFGEVFRAWDPTLARSVALKLKRTDAPDAIFSGRDFVAEAQRLAQVRHPHVLAVHGASYHDDRAGLWADWIEGETLYARLARETRLAPDALLALASELAAAVAAVHDAGIVHGDIKGSNVMIDQRGHSVLMDFGAGFKSSEEPMLAATGTPHYLAPEAIRGEPLSAAIDVYALGVLLHRAAAGRFPINAAIDPSIEPSGLRQVIGSLLAPDPGDRPTAARLMTMLAELRAAPLHRARRITRLAIGAALALVAAVSAFGYWRADGLRRETEHALARTRSINDFLTELLGRAAPDQLGPRATLRELLDSAPAAIEQRQGLSVEDRIHLQRELAQLEADMANDAAAARLASEAATLAMSHDPDGDTTLELQADALRWRAIAGDATASVAAGEALLAHANRTGRKPRLLAAIEFGLVEAEFRSSLNQASPQLIARMVERLQRLLAAPSLLDPRSESDALRRLAGLKVEQGATDEGVALAERAVARAESALGVEHPIAALNRRVLAWYLMEQGNGVAGEALFRSNLMQHEAKLGRRSRSVADDLLGLATALRLQSNYVEALAVAREAWQLANDLYPPDSRTPIDAGLMLAAALAVNREPAQSAQLLGELRARLAASRGTTNRQYLLATRQLAMLHHSQGQTAIAVPLLRECIEIGTRALDARSPLLADCRRVLDSLGPAGTGR